MSRENIPPEKIIAWWGDFAQHCRGNVAVLFLRDYFELERALYTSMAKEYAHKKRFLSSHADQAIVNHKSAVLCENAAAKMKTVRQKGNGQPLTYNSFEVEQEYDKILEDIQEVGFMRLLHYGAYLYQLIRNESANNHPDWPPGSSEKAEHNRKVLEKLRNDLKNVWAA